MPRYSAIDIGSNSIRMLAAEMDPASGLRILAADRQVVRLGQSVFRDGKLSQTSMDLAYQVLARMASEYRAQNVVAMRAVGTAALRDASNRAEFLARAREILGMPVEVISGLEEARLIHLGVQTMWPHPKQKILIMDIGGGSAELIRSENGRFEEAYSKPLGAVRLTEMFLKSDPPDPRELARLRTYAQERIGAAVARFGSLHGHRMIATSATAAAVVCAANQVRRSKREAADRSSATLAQVKRVYQQLAALPLAERAKVTGIGPRRAEIIVAGVSVLYETMREMGVPRVYYSVAGVREGIVADLAHRRVDLEQARLDPEQLRMVRALAKRYGQTGAHIRKVADLAHMLFDGLTPLHHLHPHLGRLLDAAAHLYNVGHFVNEARHHRHSMYLVANSDLPGFTDVERAIVANLCRYHRKSMPQATHEMYNLLGPADQRAVMFLAPLLRLAVALDQSQQQRVSRVRVLITAAGVDLRLESDADVDVEQWHASQVSEIFKNVYGHTLAVRVKRA